jgi:hypothetical protein
MTNRNNKITALIENYRNFVTVRGGKVLLRLEELQNE